MERNGLRHGEFPLTLRAENTCVSTTTWNSSSNVLAVIYEGQEQCHVTLYTCSNYCWQVDNFLKSSFLCDYKSNSIFVLISHVIKDGFPCVAWFDQIM